jgi:RNA recognition motif-containing protein
LILLHCLTEDDAASDVDSDVSAEAEQLKPKQALKAVGPRKSDVPAGQTVFVRNLPFDADQTSLEECFSVYGTLRMAVLVKDKETGESPCSNVKLFALTSSLSLRLLLVCKASGEVVVACVNKHCVAYRLDIVHIHVQEKCVLTIKHLCISNTYRTLNTAANTTATHNTGMPKGTAFVKFQDRVAADRCLAAAEGVGAGEGHDDGGGDLL